MRRLAAVLFIVGIFLLITAPVEGVVAPRPTQPHPDIFPCSTGCDLQTLNPVTVKAKSIRAVSYKLQTEPGCTTGTIHDDMTTVEQEARDKLHFTLQRVETAPDFVVRINCGNGQIAICGSVNIYCLGRGFPYVADVDISDLLSTYYFESRISILEHEILGHAVGTWGEQYCLGSETTGSCKGLVLFSPAPGHIDIMNTGPLSRHLLGSTETERWERVMWPLVVCSTTGYDECSGRWQFGNGLEWAPLPAPYGVWYKDGVAIWDSCDPGWGGRHSPLAQAWAHVGNDLFFDSLGYRSAAPAC